MFALVIADSLAVGRLALSSTLLKVNVGFRKYFPLTIDLYIFWVASRWVELVYNLGCFKMGGVYK